MSDGIGWDRILLVGSLTIMPVSVRHRRRALATGLVPLARRVAFRLRLDLEGRRQCRRPEGLRRENGAKGLLA